MNKISIQWIKSADLKRFDFFDKKISDMKMNIMSNLVAEDKKLASKCEEFITNEKNHWQNVQYNRGNNIEIPRAF